MSCSMYRDYEMGDLDPDQFAGHARECPVCQKYVRKDARLMALIQPMKKPLPAPELWDRIEQSLREEQQRAKAGWFDTLKRSPLLRVAAVLIIAGIGLYAGFHYWNTRPITQRIIPAEGQRLVVDLSRISLMITGYESPEIVAELTVEMDETSEIDIGRPQLLFEQAQRDLRLTVSFPDWPAAATIARPDMTLRLMTPRGQALIVNNEYGSIRVDEATGDFRLVNIYSEIDVSNSSGHAEIRNNGAPVSVAGFDGDIDVRGQNAAVTVSEITGDAIIVSSEQPIDLNGVRGNIRVMGYTGDITVAGLGAFPVDRRIELIAADQTVTLSLPDSAQVVLTASSYEGVIQSDYPMYFFEPEKRGNLYLGENNTMIQINARGNVYIRRE